MAKPQQPELARSRRGSIDQEGQELRAESDLPTGDQPRAPVPRGNRAGHRPAHDQDKPSVPPHKR